MPTEPIDTARLRLRPFTLADAPDVFAYASDPDVSRFTSWQTHQTVADSVGFIEMVMGRAPDQHTWAIRLPSHPQVIGAIEFSLKSSGIEAQIDYVLARPYWNRGLMTEAARAVLSWGFNHYPTVERVISTAVTQNVGSRRVMEKSGLKFEGTQLHEWSKTPEPVELCRYALARANPSE